MRKILISGFILSLMAKAGAGATITVEEISPSSTVTEKQEITVKWKSDTAGKFRIEVGGSGEIGTGELISENAEGNITSNTYIYTKIKPWIDFKEGDGDYNVYIYVTPSGGGDVIKTNILIKLDDVPDTPTGFKARGGNSVLFLSWDKHPDRDIKRFEIYWREAGDSDSPITAPTIGLYTHEVDVNSGEATSYTLSGLENGKRYFLSIRAVDYSDMVSSLSPEIEGIPYKTLGVGEIINEDGGCVITSLHPEGNFEILRGIRNIMNHFFPGREIVHLYYTSFFHIFKKLPPFVKEISKVISYIFDDRVLILLFIMPLIFLKKRILLGFLLLTFWISPAFSESPRHWTISLLGTNYHPDKLSEYRWDEIYGSGGHFMIEGEFGFEFFNFRYFGVLGTSLRGGFFREKGYGLIEEDGVYTPSSARDHIFYLFPLRWSLFYRLEFMRDQPLVPYGRGGFDWHFFMEKIVDGKTTEKGVVSGYHYGGGIILVLDILDKKHAAKMDEDFGVNYTGIYAEYIVQKINRKSHPFGDRFEKWDFTGKNLYVGIVFDF
jgi:hypothetical protein